METRSYEDVARDWETNANELFHALIAIEEIVLAITNMTIYAWYRCTVVSEDGSEAHFHWHGLVHFTTGRFESWRRRAARLGVRFASRKNTFKKIKCLDYAVGVLRYIACGNWQKHEQGQFAPALLPSAYQCKLSPFAWKDLCICSQEISTGIAAFLDLSKSNWKANALHMPL